MKCKCYDHNKKREKDQKESEKKGGKYHEGGLR